MENRWIDPSIFEERFYIKKATQKKLRADGKLPYVKFGRFIKYDVNDIDKLFEAHKINAEII